MKFKKRFENQWMIISNFALNAVNRLKSRFSGKFVIRLPAELHRKAYIQAKLADKSLNGWVTEVLQTVLEEQ